MDFSLWLFPYRKWGSLDSIGDSVALAESVGFRSTQLADHTISLRGVVEGDGATPTWPDWSVLATYIATRTENIRILASIVLPYRPVLVLAKQIATLDVISRGRFTLVACTGWNEREFEMLGVSFADRGQIVDEYLAALQILWTDPVPEFAGDFVSVSDLVFEPTCVQRPHVPIWIAGGTGRRPLERVLNFGQGWMARTGSTPQELRVAIAKIKDGLAARGRSDEGFVFTDTIFYADHAAAAAVFASSKSDAVMAAVGSADSIDQSLTELGEFAEAGVTELGVSFSGRSPAEIQDNIQRFGEEIIPEMR